MALERRFVVLEVLRLQRDLIGLDGALERVESICELLDVARRGGQRSALAIERSGSRTLC